jgi:hypothetical protein
MRHRHLSAVGCRGPCLLRPPLLLDSRTAKLLIVDLPVSVLSDRRHPPVTTFSPVAAGTLDATYARHVTRGSCAGQVSRGAEIDATVTVL